MADLPPLSSLTGAPAFNTSALLSGTATYVLSTSAVQSNANSRGIRVVVDVTALPVAGASLIATIEGYDPVSNKYITILASAAITTVSTNVLYFFPAAPVVANVSANYTLPASWRIKVVNGGTGGSTATLTVAASLLA